MPNLALFLFGPPHLDLDGTPVKIDRHKAMALLAYLATNPQAHSRNTLATLLWPNYDQGRARAALRRTLVTLKKAGLSEWLAADRETIKLNDQATLWVDVARFRQRLGDCLAAGHNSDVFCLPLLTEAVGLYQADFMAGFSLRDSPNFDEWQLSQAESLRRDMMSALARLVRCHSAQGEIETAIDYTQHWLAMDPLFEMAHRQLMQLYARNGQRIAALRQYQTCARILEQELATTPSAKTTALYQQIQRGEGGYDNPADMPLNRFPNPQALRMGPASVPLHNFPAQPTPFLGRDNELSEIGQRLQNPACQLLTLIGPGGIGKTRLAIQAAHEQAAAFPDGLYFVPLDPINPGDFLVSTLADHLSLSLDGLEDPTLQLMTYLHQKQLLLVLDNFEHLMRKVGLLAKIVGQAPQVKILVTSRERLNLQGEWAVEIKGMRYPAIADGSQIEDYSAVALFLHRAHQVHSGFTLSDVDKPYLARICQLMEGTPLAIELAASWVRVLSCQEIAEEIEHMVQTQDNLDFLATTLHDVPKRHQNLRGVFEHSWQRLSAEEKRVLSKLSVFQGGGRREAIEAVTGADLALISALVDKSLLTRSEARRYEMHGLLQQYAAEKLRQRLADVEEAQDRHCAYFTTFLKKREGRLRGSDQQNTLADIATEIENIRAGWRWAISQIRLQEIEDALEGLWYFHAMYSWFEEGIETFGRAAAALYQENKLLQDPHIQKLQGRVLAYLGWFFLRQGLYEQAEDLLQHSLAIFDMLNDKNHRATPLHYLGILAGEVGDFAQATDRLQASLVIYRKTNNLWGTAWVLSSLAYHLSELGQAEPEAIQVLLHESLALYKKFGNQQGIAAALNNLGYIAFRQGQYTAAKKFLKESLVLRREVGYPRGIAVTLNNLGHVTGALGEYEICKTYYREALEIAFNIHTVPLVLAALGGLAIPYAHEGQIIRARQLLDLVLQHPASNKESRERANDFLVYLNADQPHQITDPEDDQPPEFERIVKDILRESV